MRILKNSLFLILLCVFPVSLKSQEPEKVIQELIAKVEKDYNSIVPNVDKISFSNLLPSRKVKIEAVNEFSNVLVKMRIKYFRNGFKKEKISIYKRNALGNFVLVCRAIKINNTFFSIRYNNFEENYSGLFILQSQELLYDSRFYRRKSFNEKGKLIKTDNIILQF